MKRPGLLLALGPLATLFGCPTDECGQDSDCMTGFECTNLGFCRMVAPTVPPPPPVAQPDAGVGPAGPMGSEGLFTPGDVYLFGYLPDPGNPGAMLNVSEMATEPLILFDGATVPSLARILPGNGSLIYAEADSMRVFNADARNAGGALPMNAFEDDPEFVLPPCIGPNRRVGAVFANPSSNDDLTHACQNESDYYNQAGTQLDFGGKALRGWGYDGIALVTDGPQDQNGYQVFLSATRSITRITSLPGNGVLIGFRGIPDGSGFWVVTEEFELWRVDRSAMATRVGAYADSPPNAFPFFPYAIELPELAVVHLGAVSEIANRASMVVRRELMTGTSTRAMSQILFDESSNPPDGIMITRTGTLITGP